MSTTENLDRHTLEDTYTYRIMILVSTLKCLGSDNPFMINLTALHDVILIL